MEKSEGVLFLKTCKIFIEFSRKKLRSRSMKFMYFAKINENVMFFALKDYSKSILERFCEKWSPKA